jgi:hypothetical protein
MADQFPCPNPTCTHVFSLAELQTSSQVGCPRCGFRMQGRAPAPKPPARPAAAPAKAKAPVVPLASPVAAPVTTGKRGAPPAAPLIQATPVRPIPTRKPAPPAGDIDVDLVDAGLPATPQAAIVAATPVMASPFARPSAGAPEKSAPIRHDGLRTVIRVAIILFVIALSFAVVGAVVVLFVVFNPPSTDGGPRASDYSVVTGNARTLKGTDEKAFRLLLLKNTWDPDRELKIHFGALGAWRNKADELWLAVAVKDYGTTQPRDAELIQQGIEKLEGHFGESLELAAKTEPAEVAGVTAQKLNFKGQLGAVVSWGECTMFFHHGFAYWLFLGGPSKEDIQSYAAELKRPETGIALETDRKGWRAQPAKTQTFVSADGLVSVTAVEGVWEQSTPANVEFATGSLLLLGRYVKDKDNTKNAHLQVFTLEKQGDLKESIKQAKDFLEKLKKEQITGYKLTAAAEGQSDLGVVEDVGNRKGRVAELALSLGETPLRYYLLAVVNEPDRVTVVLCDCLWNSRQIWRQDFLDLLKTFKANTK